MYDKTVTQIVIALLETSLLNALLCHDTLGVPICTIQHWGNAKEPKVASQYTHLC